MGARDPYLELRGPLELTRIALPLPAVRGARRAPVRQRELRQPPADGPMPTNRAPANRARRRNPTTRAWIAHARRPWCAWMSLFVFFELAFDIAICFVCQWNMFATPLVCVGELV